jgi:hypothetical protein
MIMGHVLVQHTEVGDITVTKGHVLVQHTEVGDITE